MKRVCPGPIGGEPVESCSDARVVGTLGIYLGPQLTPDIVSLDREDDLAFIVPGEDGEQMGGTCLIHPELLGDPRRP